MVGPAAEEVFMSQGQSKKEFWAGWIVSGLASAVLLFSASFKFMRSPQVVEGFTKGGYPEAAILPIGIAEVACVVLFLIPRTTVLGAAFSAAYLGGAVATHVRGGDSFLAPVVVGVIVWVGAWLRTPALRTVFPLVTKR